MSTEARKSEAQNAPVTIDYRGHTFTIERDYNEWSVDLLESIEEGKSVGIVRGALGAAQWQVVKSMNLKVRDLNELATALASALGFDSMGESAASSD